MDKLPEHLGGHMNKVHIDGGALHYVQRTFGLESMIDIGCGPGSQVVLATQLGFNAIGIDGDWTVLPKDENFYLHDFTTGPWLPSISTKFDLAWSVEFLEHIEEKYLPNVFDTFKLCKYVIVTHALPGQNGHHHVNCQFPSYWIDKFSEYNFQFLPIATEHLRMSSTMVKPFIGRTGLLFENMIKE